MDYADLGNKKPSLQAGLLVKRLELDVSFTSAVAAEGETDTISGESICTYSAGNQYAATSRALAALGGGHVSINPSITAAPFHWH